MVQISLEKLFVCYYYALLIHIIQQTKHVFRLLWNDENRREKKFVLIAVLTSNWPIRLFNMKEMKRMKRDSEEKQRSEERSFANRSKMWNDGR